MFKIGLALLSNVFGLFKDLNSGENREKKFHVAMRKNARKALNIAEDYFEIVEDNKSHLPKSVQRRLKKLSKKFNEFD